VKQLDGDQSRVGCLLVNGGGDRGPMPDPVDRVIALTRERFAWQDYRAREMRMIGVDAAVEDRDRDTASGPIGKRWIAQSIPHLQ
jgi:hypothetical protein